MTLLVPVLLAAFLAYANGANDNFKGVATLFGSGRTDYRRALGWATITTFAGSVTAVFLATQLLKAFSGKGLVPDEILALRAFPLAVAFGAAATVMLATRLGFPISTTHAITGSLVGAGLVASPAGVNFETLGSTFFLPLIASPFVALACAAALYPVLHASRARMGIGTETCVCVGSEVVTRVPGAMAPGQAIAAASATLPSLKVASSAVCRQEYTGRFLSLSAATVIDAGHYLSAGAVSFARGLNDAPKIAAILLAAGALEPASGIATVAVAMAAGGILSARRVAETMAHKVTAMNAGQGFTANLVTSAVVFFASKAGMPVSTTHVSCGTLFGIGVVTGQARWKTIAGIVTAWVTTLPAAAALGAAGFAVLRALA